ncbi:hypothetical protein [Moraxella equi]|uniref:Uncharacterized protein n=1 Tax=Moraxella equi TaxID=60442 RepID=A0ABX3NH83_9GAMM|nr:hypothetical protein [Moraxella equi]OPH37916.1 hypothetical protein B5J93_07470 [Moraxella equi]
MYLDDYGLPREIGGNFICDGDTPKLPKDCQGREIRSEAELNAFTTKHQLPLALNDFICKNGVPIIPVKDLEYWKRHESIMPTCKDSRGRKRPCV